MKKILMIIFSLVLFSCFINIAYAEEGSCSKEKVSQLKKEASIVSAVSEFYEDGLNLGRYDANLVTVYGLPKGFYATNKRQNVLFEHNDEGSISKIVSYDFGNLNVYSTECSGDVLKSFKLDLKKINSYYDHEACEDIRDEAEICSKFYNTDNMSESVFLNEVNKYKNGKINLSNSASNIFDFVKKYFVIAIIAGVVIVFGIVALIIKRIKSNKLD